MPALIAVSLALALNAALAGAQDPPSPVDPVQAIVDDPGQQLDLDLEVESQNLGPVRPALQETAGAVGGGLGATIDNFTPRAAVPNPKPTDAWKLVAGGGYGAATTIANSPTTFDSELRTVRFLNSDNGLAGGSACKQSPAGKSESESLSAYRLRVARCASDAAGPDGERIPVVYRYTDTVQEGPRWQQVELPGADRPGFVGAIAWIGSTGRALAVGGDGSYPEREAPWDGRETTDPSKSDVAGKGRAWLFADGAWTELDLSAQRADTADRAGMRGMTALDFWPDASGGELGWAGALGQVWKWESSPGAGGRFTQRLDAKSPEAEMFDAAQFRFRVREIRAFSDSPLNHAFFATTSGCCAASKLENLPKLLAVGDRYAAPRWYVRAFGFDPREADDNLARVGDQTARRQNVRQDTLDSLYSFVLGVVSGNASVSAVTSAGGPAPGPGEREPGSVITEPTPVGLASSPRGNRDPGAYPYSLRTDVKNTSLSSARLVAADGDTNRDGRPDLAVGVLRSSGRGLVVSTQASERPPSTDAIKSNCLDAGGNIVAPRSADEFRQNHRAGRYLSCQEANAGSGAPPAFEQDKLDRSVASRYSLVPSYELAAIDMVGDSGVSWAVGAGGAILRQGGPNVTLTAAAEPEPPRLGPARPRPLKERSPYDAARPPLGGQAGAVPALSTQPFEALPRPRLEAAGMPDPERLERTVESGEGVSRIVISRDGSEGWAIGPVADEPYTLDLPRRLGNAFQATLYHYRDGRWTRCDPQGVAGRLAADPACASIAPLLRYRDAAGQAVPVKLVAAARVPYEADDDPANDDEFEVVAIGTGYRESSAVAASCAVLRYRDGSWELDRELQALARGECNGLGSGDVLREIVYTAPDDGWILGQKALYRLDGEGWIACHTVATGDPINRERCGNPLLPDGRSRLPQAGAMARIAGMTSAGGRVYLYGYRNELTGSGGAVDRVDFPMILYRDQGGGWKADGGGLDPGFAENPDTAEQGQVDRLAVASGPGGYEGWASGRFGKRLASAQAPLLRLTATNGWQRWPIAGDAALNPLVIEQNPTGVRVAVQPANGGTDSVPRALIAYRSSLLELDHERQRWQELPAPFTEAGFSSTSQVRVMALAPDAQGGYWAALRASHTGFTVFYRVTDRPRRPVFEEVANPVTVTESGSLTALAGQPDGSLWAASSSGLLFRYDRMAGWERASVPGWDPGRLVTRRSAAYAVAVNEAGVGVAVGERGRIADLSPGGVVLDRAAGQLCDLAAPVPPCGTGRDLEAAAVAPDGSAMAGGRNVALLWRPADGEFRAIDRPEVAPTATITGIALPRPDRAWLTTDRGLVFAGRLDGEAWRWLPEALDDTGTPLSFDSSGKPQALSSIALDGLGRGYAVGERGLVLERSDDGARPWRRLATGFRDDLYSVTLPAGGGPGALIGAANGAILTLSDGRFDVARAGAPYRAETVAAGTFVDEASTGTTAPPFARADRANRSSPVVGLALLPGLEDGQVEAWAALPGSYSRPGTSQLLHFSSDPSEPLLDPARRAQPLADTPDPRPGEISLASFGYTRQSPNSLLSEPTMRVIEEIAARAGKPGGPGFSLFSGDVYRHGGITGAALLDEVEGQQAEAGAFAGGGPRSFRRFGERIAERLDRAGAPLFAAVGHRDLSVTRDPLFDVVSTERSVRIGENLAWRQAMAARPWPRGKQETLFEHGSLSFRAVADDALAQRSADQRLQADVPGAGAKLDQKIPTGGASTHYAVDVIDSARGTSPIARLIVADTSARSLAASDPLQQPSEGGGGQAAWLEKMLCLEGSDAAAAGCTRVPGQQAIVITNTPTYSYGAGVEDTQTDATAFEALLMRNKVNLVVSGRLGWNGLYWATAPGVHVPCPGGEYRTQPPSAETRDCTSEQTGAPDPQQQASKTARRLAGMLDGLGAPPPPAAAPGQTGAALNVSGVLPVVIASSAGGEIPANAGDAAAGYWRGSQIVRLDRSGDPLATIVEQRPALDWLTIEGARHVLPPGARLNLEGVGREPLAPADDGDPGVRFVTISAPAITHRYDLVEADPERPYLPKVVEGNGNPHGYVQLDPTVATIDSTGKVIAQRGNRGRVYALAILSVGDKVASWPLVFLPRRSYTPPASPRLGAVAVPEIRVLGFNAASLQAPTQPPPSTPPPPVGVSLSVPTPPSIPGFPTAASPPVTPPVPPVPPAPPSGQQGVAIDLSVNPAGLTVPPTTGVTAQPTPPVNPSPPSGARREAKQRQAATAKSEEGGGPQAGSEGGTVDTGSSPIGGPESAMTRRDRVKPAPDGFTPLARANAQPSAWTTGLQWGGGIGLMALGLALGFTTLRPRSRSRPPVVPAPAWTRRRR